MIFYATCYVDFIPMRIRTAMLNEKDGMKNLVNNVFVCR